MRAALRLSFISIAGRTALCPAATVRAEDSDTDIRKACLEILARGPRLIANDRVMNNGPDGTVMEEGELGK